jgi:hypothetical protein
MPALAGNSINNYDLLMQDLEDDLIAGKISNQQFDSLSAVVKSNHPTESKLSLNSQSDGSIPEWALASGIKTPEGLIFNPSLSYSTSADNPKEGFNSITYVYEGKYDELLNQASLIATKAHLSKAPDFVAKGGPSKATGITVSDVSYLNYNLARAETEYLISVQVSQNGLLTIIVTDNHQLKKCLLAYAPLNGRGDLTSNQKKQ